MRFVIYFFILLLVGVFWVHQNQGEAEDNPLKEFYSANIENINKDYARAEKVKSPLLVQEYTIQKGDSLWNLAKKFSIGIETIISFNELKNVHLVQPNTKILIPNRDGLLYKKKGNESLSEVVEIYKADYKSIAFFNHNHNGLFEDNFFLKDVRLNFRQRMELLGSEFLKPISIIKLTSGYGFRIHPVTKKRSFHKGIDIRGRIGEKVYAARGGYVSFSGVSSGFGKVVYINHTKNYQTVYGHLSKIFVRAGQRVHTQQLIGLVGNTGISTGPHLHFEVRKNRKAINPLDVMGIY